MIYAAMRDALCVRAADEERVVGFEDVECVTADGERVLVGTREGLHRSTDAGATFERVLGGHVTALADSPHHAGEVWAGTEPSRAYRSTDGGRSWSEREGLTDLPSSSAWSFPPRPHTHHVRWIQPDAHAEGRWYLAIEAGALVRTDDTGETWVDRPDDAPRDTHTLATHPDAPGRIYDAAGDGYAESTDGGESWSWRESGLDRRYCWSVAVDPVDPDHRLVSAARGPGSAHSPPGEAYVFRRRDGEWERVEGLPSGRGVMRHVLGTDGRDFYALCNRGLFRSPDGESWSGVALPWRDRFEEQAPAGLAVA